VIEERYIPKKTRGEIMAESEKLKKKIKCPYDFDERNLKKIRTLIDKTDKAEISSLFFAPYAGDMRSARLPGAFDPKTREEYAAAVRTVIEAGFEPEVLFQEPGQILSESQIKMYVDMGVRRFSVYEDENAYRIKTVCPKAYVCASLTKLLSPGDIEKLSPVYDEICLHFWYNRELDIIERLPPNRSYSILVNTSCSSTCTDCRLHWFGPEDVRKGFVCTGDKEHYSGHIYDVSYFFDYIDIYKLQHRDCMAVAVLDLEILIRYFENPVKKYEREYYNQGTAFPEFTQNQIK